MSSSDPEDDICVMEFVKRRKALLPVTIKPEKKDNTSSNTTNQQKKSQENTNGHKKKPPASTKESNNNKKRKRKESDDESDEDSSDDDSDSDNGDDDYDDDDDKPIGELVKKKKPVTSSSSSSGKVKKGTENNDTSTATKKASKSSTNELTRKSNEFYNDTDKGKLVQRLLVRWWFAIEWPKPEEIGTPPPGYEPLDGFPGVFISTRRDAFGKLIDLRDKTNCPCLQNLSSWTSQRLKETCIIAYQKQMEVLKNIGEENTAIYRTLGGELREVKAINTDRADREGKKYSF